MAITETPDSGARPLPSNNPLDVAKIALDLSPGLSTDLEVLNAYGTADNLVVTYSYESGTDTITAQC